MNAVRRLLLAIVLLPLQGVLFALIAMAELFSVVRRVNEPDAPDICCDACSIVILNWNGRHLLEESLPAVCAAVEHHGRAHEILVVDNGSSDDSLEWIAREFPSVEVLPLAENLGFGEGNNRGVAHCSHDIVVLLNNDMIVAHDFLAPLLEPFEQDSEIFAVSARIEFPAGRRLEETGNTQARWRRGYLELAHEPLTRAHEKRRELPVLWAGGGSAAFDRQRFLALGGFAGIYSPCYVEDTELSYRAWRRDWKVLLASSSRVLHKHRGSTSVRFEEHQLRTMIEQRKLWYVWRNFDLMSMARHCAGLPFHLGHRVPVAAYFRALAALPRVLGSRMREPRRSCSDRELLGFTSDTLRGLEKLRPQRRSPGRDGRKPSLLMVSAYLPHLGFHGGAGRVFQLLKRLARRFDVTLVSFIEDEQELQLVDQAEPHCHRIVPLIRQEFDAISPFAYEPFEEFNSPRLRAALREVLAEEDFDLIDFEWTQMAQFADLVPDVPKVLSEIEVNWAAERTRIPYLRSAVARFHQRYRTLQTLYREVEQCRKVDCVICVTNEDRGYLTRFLPGRRIEVVNTGVDIDDFGFEPKVGEPGTLLYVGAFRHQPNTDAMLYFCSEVLPRVRRQGLHPHLYIVGSSPPAQIRELASDPAITVTGYVDDIREYYERCQVVIVPLRTGVGIRGKVLEAWAVGRPVIATRLACQGLDVLQGANALLADDPEEFADWVAAVLRHPEFGERLGRAGRETVEQTYSWETIGEQMVELCCDVASTGESTTGGPRN